MNRPPCHLTPAWAALQAQFDATGKRFDLRQAFAADPGRFAVFSQDAPHVFADLSKNLIDARTQALLLDLARQRGVEPYRDAMFAGEKINRSEDRAVMHFLLRNPAPGQQERAPAAPENIATKLLQVHETLAAMLAYAEQVRLDKTITDIVNIGIGGSDLGAQMAVLGLDAFRI